MRTSSLLVVPLLLAASVASAEKVGTVTAGGLKAAPARIGVIAADGRGHYGYAIGYADRALAERDAVRGCGAAGCKVIMSVNAYCIAYSEARTSDGGYYFWVAYDVREDWASNRAYAFCATANATRPYCKVPLVKCQ